MTCLDSSSGTHRHGGIISFRRPSQHSQESLLSSSSSKLGSPTHSFPSVFLSPYTQSSLFSFLLALPAPSDGVVVAAFSSLSTSALLSSSASIKSKNLLIKLEDEHRASSKDSIASQLTTALKSLFSAERPSFELVRKPRRRFNNEAGDVNLRSEGNVSTSNVIAQTVTFRTKNLPADAQGVQSKENVEDKSRLIFVDMDTDVEGESELKNDVQKIKKNENSDVNKAQNIGKYLLAGALSTIVSRTCVAPLERLKLEYIVGGSKRHWVHVLQEIWLAEGLGGFWKGNTVNLLRMVPFKSINFLLYDMFSKEMLEKQGKKKISNFDRLTIGAVSGAAATLLCLPLDTVRTRLVAPGGEALGGMLGCFHQMIQKEGYLSLYRGLVPALLSMVPTGAVFYGVYDILKAAYLMSPKAQRELQKQIEAARESNTDNKSKPNPQVELGTVRTLMYGAIAGACSEVATYPLEVVRRQLQLQQAATRINLIKAFQLIIERDGLGALFSGVVPSTVQVLPAAALSYLVYESLKSVLKIT